MSNTIPGNHKHLTLKDRLYIEESLNDGRSFRDIARYLCKDPTTIAKEVRLHRVNSSTDHGSFNNPKNFCVKRFRCKKTNACEKVFLCDRHCKTCPKCNQVCKDFVRETCLRLERSPHVCNGCPKDRRRCMISSKYDYNARAAQRFYEQKRSLSRSGVNLTKTDALRLDKTISPLIAQGQSPYMIIANHPELGLSVRSLYTYIDQGVLLTRNIDLKRKVRFKPRRCHQSQILDRSVFVNRTYQDFRALGLLPEHYAQMDTVQSGRGSSKCILTLYLPDIELLIARLLPRCTAGAVCLAFAQIYQSLGSTRTFQEVFPVILTDRGREFSKPDKPETAPDGTKRTSLYYCDPMRSNQKGGIENVHTMLRMIIPKGTILEEYSQWDIRKAVDHVNSSPRRKLNGKTPYELALKRLGPDIVGALGLKPIPPDSVMLSPRLLNQ